MPIPNEDVLTPEQIAAFDAKYEDDGWACISKTNRKDPAKFDFQVAIRKPDMKEYNLWKARSREAASAPRAQELLVKTILIHPTQEKLDALVAKYPGIYESDGITNALNEMLGLKSNEFEKT